MTVTQILSDQYDSDHFRGYDSGRISYFKLRAILAGESTECVNASKVQKATYLIVDDRTGQHYGRSATSGRDKLMRKLIEFSVTDYAKKFRHVSL